MANNAKTFAQYTACTNPKSTDILVITSNVSGNAVTMQLSVNNLLSNSSSIDITANVVVANVYVIVENTTPANSADLPPSVPLNGLWSDGTYLYFYDGVSVKRAQLNTF